MDIGMAVHHLRRHARVRRAGWNGKGMWLGLMAPIYVTESEDGVSRAFEPFVFMKTADDKLVPWLCSQTDLLASDWELAE